MSDDELFDECPLCAEEVDMCDLNFKPCTCGYQICTFCFEKICNGDNRCPACRRGYPEEQVAYAPATPIQIAKYKAMKLVKDGFVAPPDLGDRKHLSNTRIEQKNLVYVLGFPMKYNDPDLLRHHDYFGQFGSITKLQISPRARSAGQPASFAVHVTYSSHEEAKRAISALEGLEIEGRAIKATYGMNKYCANFLKFIPCHSPNCLFLHEEVKDNDDSHYSYSGQYRKPGYKPVSGPPVSFKRSDSRGFGRLLDKDSKGSALPATASWAKTPSSNSDLNDGLRSTISDFPTLSSHIEVALRSPSKPSKRRGRAPPNSNDFVEQTHSSVSIKRDNSPVLAQDPFEDLSVPDNENHEIPIHSNLDNDLPDPLSSSDLVYSSEEENASCEANQDEISTDMLDHDKISSTVEIKHSPKECVETVSSADNFETNNQSQIHFSSNQFSSPYSTLPLYNGTASDISYVERLNDRFIPVQEIHNLGSQNPGIINNDLAAYNMDVNFMNRHIDLANKRSAFNHISNSNIHSNFPINDSTPRQAEPAYHNHFNDTINNYMSSHITHTLPRSAYINHMDIPGFSRTPVSKPGPQKVMPSGSRFQFAQLPSQGITQSPNILTRPELSSYKISSDAVNVPSRSNSGNYPPGITPHWSPEETAQTILSNTDNEIQSPNPLIDDPDISLPFDSFSSNGGIEVQLKDLFLADLQKRGKTNGSTGLASDVQADFGPAGSDFSKLPPGVFPPPLAYSLDQRNIPARQTRLPSFENLTKPPPAPYSNIPMPFFQGSGFNPHIHPVTNLPSGHEELLSSRSRQSSVGLIPKQLPPRQKEGSRFFNRPAPQMSNFSSEANTTKNGFLSTISDPSHINPTSNMGPDNVNPISRLPEQFMYQDKQKDVVFDVKSKCLPNELTSPIKQGFFTGTSTVPSGIPGNSNIIPQIPAQVIPNNILQPGSFRPSPQAVSQGLPNNLLSSFPNGSQGSYNINSLNSYPGFTQGPFNGFQGNPQNHLQSSFIENVPPNLPGNQSLPFFNNRNFNSIQGDVRSSNFFPPNLGAPGYSIPFAGQVQDPSPGWPVSSGNFAAPRTQAASVATEVSLNGGKPSPGFN